MYINWEGPLIKISPKFGSDLQADHQKGVPTPTYGNFGGPQISGEGGDWVDSLDKLFETHDTSIGTDGLLVAHAVLIDGIIDLETHDDGLLEVLQRESGEIVADPEATLYGGFTLFALTAQVMQLDELDGDNNPSLLGLFEGELAKFDLNVSTVLTNAAEYMETGLKAVPNEGKGLNGLFHIWEHQFDIA